MAKQLIKNYTYNTTTKTVTLTDFTTVVLERLQLIVDTTTNTIIYNFADSSVATATVAANVITLSVAPGTSTDKLQIIYDCATGDPIYDTPALPSGAATATNQTNGTQQAKLTDGTNTVNVLKSDGTAAGQNAQMVAGTYLPVSFTTTTVQAVASTDTGNYRWVSVQLQTQGTGSTVTFQTSNDNINWFSNVLMLSSSTISPGVVSSTTTGMWSGPIYGRYFRLNVTGISAGTTAGTITFFANAPTTLSIGGQVALNGTSAINVNPNASVSGSITRIKSAASTNATTIKASVGQIYDYELFNSTASAKYVKLYNKASVPTVGTDIPLYTIIVPANGSVIAHSVVGLPFATGISFAITGALADTDTTAIAVDDVHGYIRTV